MPFTGQTKHWNLKEDHPYGNLTLSWVYLRKNSINRRLNISNKLPEDDDYWKMLRGYIYVKLGTGKSNKILE